MAMNLTTDRESMPDVLATILVMDPPALVTGAVRMSEGTGGRRGGGELKLIIDEPVLSCDRVA